MERRKVQFLLRLFGKSKYQIPQSEVVREYISFLSKQSSVSMCQSQLLSLVTELAGETLLASALPVTWVASAARSAVAGAQDIAICYLNQVIRILTEVGISQFCSIVQLQNRVLLNCKPHANVFMLSFSLNLSELPCIHQSKARSTHVKK